ncbi:MAG: aspartoacylase [Gemmatimonadetes bacterium]|nr:MAG: aspartoacylase [Gemmatimonadota bacterium]
MSAPLILHDELHETSFENRLLGTYGTFDGGPIVFCVGAMHGNERSGVIALWRVLQRLEHEKVPFRGKFMAVIGNLTALRLGKRYVDKDLNRIWTNEIIARTRSPYLPPGIEYQEQQELIAVLDDALQHPFEDFFVIDLHTSSARSAPFVLFGDTLRNRRFASRLPVPLILGIEEALEGVMLGWVNDLGCVSYGFEAGQHDDPSSIDYQEAAIWISLVSAGCLSAKHFPEVRQYHHKLARATRGLPRTLEVRYRHGITPADRFRMKPGFENLTPVHKHQLLATDRKGDIRAPESGRVFLPLYQGQGDDGFFLARRIQPFWLYVSSFLRRLRTCRWVHLLPGVTRHPHQSDTFIVNTRIARLYTIQIFHLLGFRKKRLINGMLVVSRRKYDIHPPHRRGNKPRCT